MTGTASDIVIRPAEMADAATIHAGLQMIADALDMAARITSSVEDIRIQGFADPPAFHALIAESGKRFAGMSLFFRSFSTWRGQTGAYIQDFVVDPAFRGTNLAERLIAATAREAATLWDARYLRLSVDVDNSRARRFYERAGLGWARSEAIHAAYDDDFQRLARQHVTTGRQPA